MKLPAASFLGRQSRAGQTVAEFALSATVFLLLVFGVMEMALNVYNYNTACAAAREAVRYAIAHSPTSANPATKSQIRQVAINYAPALNLTASNISVSWVADPNLARTTPVCPSCDALVVISHQYRLQIPFVAPIALTISATSQMLVSQ
jgi:Flp pilus assembly protein TadG